MMKTNGFFPHLRINMLIVFHGSRLMIPPGYTAFLLPTGEILIEESPIEDGAPSNEPLELVSRAQGSHPP